MTPSKYIKSKGLPSLAYVAREAGVIERTLHNWYHNKFKLFEVVVAGVQAMKISSPAARIASLNLIKMQNEGQHND